MLPLAERDIDEAAQFIAQDRLDATLRFYDAVNETTKGICENPRRWKRFEGEVPGMKEVRVRAVVDFSDFLIFYRVDADMVDVVRVIHGARDLPTVLKGV